MTRALTLLRSLLLTTLALAAGSASADVTATVTGTYTINGKVFTPTFVYAVAGPDSFDKTKEGVELLFTMKAVSEKDLSSMMPGEGPRLSASIGAEGSLYGIVLIFEGGSASASGTGQVFEKKRLDATRIQGRLFSAKDVEIGSTKGRFDLTFDAPLFRPKKEAPPTAAERSAAAKSPQAQAYAAYLKAIRAGDLAGLRKVVTSELGASMDAPDFKEKLAFLKEMTPKSVSYVRVIEASDTATLEVETATDRGTVDCAREGGSWKIGKQSWKNK